MIIRLKNYTSGYRIVSLAKCRETLINLTSQKLDTIFIYKNKLILYPDNKIIAFESEILEKFSYCDDYDVFEINDLGHAYLYYNNESVDNAFIVTGKCNSNCIMCPAGENVRKNAFTMNINNLLEIVNHIPSDAQHLTITGGEPFLLGRDIFILFEALKNKFIKSDFLLLTNGRIFSIYEYCELLRKTIPAQTIIGIPIHGYDSATHDAITQASGSFEETLLGIKTLLRMGIRIELRLVISKITAQYIDKMANLIINTIPDVETVKIMGLEMLGSAAKNQSDIWISYSSAFKKSKKAILSLISAGIDVGLYNFPLCAVDQEYWPICAQSITDYKIHFSESCNNCSVKDACGGIFSGTYRLAKYDITPIGGNK